MKEHCRLPAVCQISPSLLNDHERYELALNYNEVAEQKLEHIIQLLIDLGTEG